MNKTGVLLVNLGTPNEPTVPAVRKYLREFLMDSRVIDIPYLNRWLLVNLIIAPFRSPKSTKVYQKLWTKDGSPLKIYGEKNVVQLQERLDDSFVVELAMRYQEPSIEDALNKLKKENVKKIIIIPLFPQYASATTGSVIEKVSEVISKWQIIPQLSFVNYFYDNPKFVEGFVNNAQKLLRNNSYDHFIFSYHGIPERQLKKAFGNCNFGECCANINSGNSMCYRAQCFETSRLLAKELGINKENYTTSFQSRLGKTPWIQPYTEDKIKELSTKGKKKILAFSPAFVADCLETTIEVGEEYKEEFQKNGGQQWDLVESLNDTKTWIDLLEDLVKSN